MARSCRIQVLDPTNDLRNNRSVERAIFLLNSFVMLPRTRERPESRLKKEKWIKMMQKMLCKIICLSQDDNISDFF